MDGRLAGRNLACALTATAQTAPTPPAPAPAAGPGHDPRPGTVEGQPLDTRATEKPDDKSLFPGQTRAPYHASGVAFTVAALPVKLARPWSLAFLPGGEMLVTERGGALRKIDAKGVLSDPIAGLPAIKSKGGAGLLEVTVDPNFAKTRRLYLSYDLDQGNEADGIAVARAGLSPDGKTLTEVVEIFRAGPAMTRKDGNPDKGGRMAVAKDGTLFIALGGRSLPHPSSVPQDLDKTLGKIVHITSDGKPAPGNPFIGKAGAKAEIWSSGHRNPSGLAFDAQGRLWEIEHGPRGGDELNRIERGKNYGWPVIAHGLDDDSTPLGEGLTAKPGLEQPRYYWDPVIAPAGLAFYNGDLFPKWKGNVFVGALRGEHLSRLTLKGDTVVSEEALLAPELNARIRDVRVAPDGSVYVMTDAGGLFRLTPK